MYLGWTELGIEPEYFAQHLLAVTACLSDQHMRLCPPLLLDQLQGNAFACISSLARAKPDLVRPFCGQLLTPLHVSTVLLLPHRLTQYLYTFTMQAFVAQRDVTALALPSGGSSFVSITPARPHMYVVIAQALQCIASFLQALGEVDCLPVAHFVMRKILALLTETGAYPASDWLVQVRMMLWQAAASDITPKLRDEIATYLPGIFHQILALTDSSVSEAGFPRQDASVLTSLTHSAPATSGGTDAMVARNAALWASLQFMLTVPSTFMQEYVPHIWSIARQVVME
jgi:hypothetical protein